MVNFVINENKNKIYCIQNAIDIMLENQNTYAIDRNLMLKLNDCFEKEFDSSFVASYLNFISTFSNFFDMLLKKLKDCEKELLDCKELVGECYFVFNLDEFKIKSILMPYQDILDSLNGMFPENISFQGIVFYMHLNSLLKKYMFTNNKIRVVEKLPVFDIDYGVRLEYLKEKYITNFRHELEEGVRSGVFLDDDEIVSYVKEEINNLENEMDV